MPVQSRQGPRCALTPLDPPELARVVSSSAPSVWGSQGFKRSAAKWPLTATNRQTQIDPRFGSGKACTKGHLRLLAHLERGSPLPHTRHKQLSSLQICGRGLPRSFGRNARNRRVHTFRCTACAQAPILGRRATRMVHLKVHPTRGAHCLFGFIRIMSPFRKR